MTYKGISDGWNFFNPFLMETAISSNWPNMLLYFYLFNQADIKIQENINQNSEK